MKFKQVNNWAMVNLERVEAIQKRFNMEQYHIAYVFSDNSEAYESFETKEDRDEAFGLLIDILCQFDCEKQAKKKGRI